MNNSLRTFKSLSENRHRTPWLLGAGAALGAMALFVQYRSRQVEREHPPQGKFIEVDGIRLHYIERGHGQPLVLLHGNGSMAAELDISGLLDLAAENYRVIAFDRPGYGYSDRPRTTVWNPEAQARLLHRALQKLGVEQPLVAGHSWGALVAIALALQKPDDISGLLLLSGYYYPTPRIDVPLFSPPAIPVIGDLVRSTVAPLLGRLAWQTMLHKLFSPAEAPPRFQREYPVWMSLRPSQIRAAAEEIALMIPSVYRLRKRYHELKMPIIIMAGTGDVHVMPHLHSERLHRALPHSELVLVPEVGHMIQQTVPHQVLTAIDRLASPPVLATGGSNAIASYPAQPRSLTH